MLFRSYPIRTGLAKDVIRQTDTHGLPLSEITIAEALKPDYATALVGKWHLGHVDPFWPPTQQGFDLFFGLPYSHDMKPLSLYTKEPGVELTSEDPAMDKLTDRFFQRGLRFIDENRDRPFFLMLALTAPHVPLDPHPDHAGHSAAAEYGDVVEEIDANVGRLFTKLKELNLDDDTLVIVTSDNGPWFEGSTAGLRDRKGGAGWEGGYRVPFLARQPGRIPAGLISDSMAMNIDLLPTLARWTGLPVPSAQLDGADISSLLTLRAAPSPHDELIFFINEDVAAIRTQRWKYVVRSFYRGYEAPLDRPDVADWTLLVDMPKTYTSFTPFGLALTIMLGAVVAERSGLMVALIRASLAGVRRAILTPVVFMIGILSCHTIDAGFLVYVPLAGMVYASAGRNPVLGLLVGFSGAAVGLCGNLLPGQVDVLLLGITETGARLLARRRRVRIPRGDRGRGQPRCPAQRRIRGSRGRCGQGHRLSGRRHDRVPVREWRVLLQSIGRYREVSKRHGDFQSYGNRPES